MPPAKESTIHRVKYTKDTKYENDLIAGHEHKTREGTGRGPVSHSTYSPSGTHDEWGTRHYESGGTHTQWGADAHHGFHGTHHSGGTHAFDGTQCEKDRSHQEALSAYTGGHAMEIV